VTKSRALIVLAAAALITAGCGSSSDTESTPASPSETTVNPSQMEDHQAPPERLTIDVTIQGGNVTPSNEQLTATVKQPIIIRVNSDAADELHVHSNPEHTFKVEAKQGQSFQFTVDVPGKVDVELHQLKRTIASIAVQ
jgi:ABC-type glycerol-3-phosphate transport system substrate-binding protein